MWKTRRGRSGKEDWRDARVEAVAAILQDAGLDGLRALARGVEVPYQVGRSAAEAPMSPSDANELLSRHLCDPDQALDRLAFGYAVGRVSERGAEWAIQQLRAVRIGSDRRSAHDDTVSPAC